MGHGRENQDMSWLSDTWNIRELFEILLEVLAVVASNGRLVVEEGFGQCGGRFAGREVDSAIVGEGLVEGLGRKCVSGSEVLQARRQRIELCG